MPVLLTEITDLFTPSGPCIHPKAASARNSCLSQNRPTSAECFEEDGALYVPIDLPPHAEYDAVLKAVGRRLQEVSDLISAAGGAAGL